MKNEQIGALITALGTIIVAIIYAYHPFGQGDTEKGAPILNSLTSDRQSPQTAGKIIEWTAKATDPDTSDNLLYKFLRSGPSTGDNFVEAQGWSSDNTWTWTTNEEDIGTNKAQVLVRDSKHAPDTGFDDSEIVIYTINAKIPTEPPVINSPPVVNKLIPDKTDPQVAGSTIKWTAYATDPDTSDNLLYKFLLSGPSTDDRFVTKQSWSEDNTWRWTTTDEDIGRNQVQVMVIDGHHAARTGTGYDDFLTESYTINTSKVDTLPGHYSMDGNMGKVMVISHISGNTYNIAQPSGDWPWQGTAMLDGGRLSGNCRSTTSLATFVFEGTILGDRSVDGSFKYITDANGNDPLGRVDTHHFIPV